MTKYYFVGVMLPPLSFDSQPEIRFSAFIDLLRQNLTKKDFEQTKRVRELYDVLNLRSLWQRESLDPRGNLTENELEEALATQVGLPQYIYDFLDQYEKQSDRLLYFPRLIIEFLENTIKYSKGFFKDYLAFERAWRLVFVGFRAKKLGRDLSVELQHEDPEEPLIAQLLAQKDAKVYEPPEGYEDLRVLFKKYGDDPLALEKAIDEYRFNYIENLVDKKDQFSLSRILGYMAQLVIVEKWFESDKNKGIKIVEKIVKGTS